MHILLATESVDFHKDIDGPAAVCRQVLRSDPFSGIAYNTKKGTISTFAFALFLN